MARPKQKLIDLECSHCNKSFQKYPSQIKANKDTVFCGNQCVIDYRKVHWKCKINKICIECGKEFKIYQSELNKCESSGRYCSKECQANRNYLIQCQICKREFKIYKSDLERGDKRFCSKECYNNRMNPIEYFFRHISADRHPNECWIWIGKKDKDSYGIMWKNKKKIRAHRYSMLLYGKVIADNKLACHQCDTPSCVNPDHLFEGTHKDNIHDAMQKGRRKSKNVIR